MKRLTTLMFHDVFSHSPDESGFSGAAADRYKMSGETFSRHLQAAAAVCIAPPVLLTGTSPEMLSSKDGQHFAITVDDGGVCFLDQIAPRLDEFNWRAHCLVSTDYLAKPRFLHPHHVRELHKAGHVIGTHSHTHPSRIDALDFDSLVQEWRESRQILEDHIGAAVKVGSVPGGFDSPRVQEAAAVAGIKQLFNSEPVTAVNKRGGCEIYGRHTLRRESPPGLSGKLIGSGSFARRQQWVIWNGKKILKKSLGTGYKRLSDSLAS